MALRKGTSGGTREQMIRDYAGRSLRERVGERLEEARKIHPSIAPYVLPLERASRRLSEHLAPELFKWLGWSVAIAALNVVALRLEVPWLRVIPWVLGWAVMLRIGWFFWPNQPQSTTLADGTVVLPPLTWLWFGGGLFLVGASIFLAWVVAFGLSGAIARSDMFKDALPQASESTHAPVPVKTAARSTSSQPGAPPAPIPPAPKAEGDLER